jgi:hypothetical protein
MCRGRQESGLNAVQLLVGAIIRTERRIFVGERQVSRLNAVQLSGRAKFPD